MNCRRLVIIAVIAVVAVTFVLIYFLFDPSSSHFFPKCPFWALTGYKCPGCGSQRAIHALLSGDLAGAWRFNAVLVLFLPIIAVYAVAEFFRARLPRFYAFVNRPFFTWSIFAIFMLWWILRNVFGW